MTLQNRKLPSSATRSTATAGEHPAAGPATPWCLETPTAGDALRVVHRTGCASPGSGAAVPLPMFRNVDGGQMRLYVARNPYVRACPGCIGGEPATEAGGTMVE